MVNKIPGRHRGSGHREASTRITVSLATVDFPIAKEDLERRVGDASIPLEPDGPVMSLRDMLAQIDRERFMSIADVQDALDANWQIYRAETGMQAPPPNTLTQPGEGGNFGLGSKGFAIEPRE